MSELTIDHTVKDGVNVLTMTGRMTMMTCKDLQNYVDTTIKEGSNIIFNLVGIENDGIDSFGIGVVVKTKVILDKKKGQFKVIVNKSIERLFRKCRLNEYIILELR